MGGGVCIISTLYPLSSWVLDAPRERNCLGLSSNLIVVIVRDGRKVANCYLGGLDKDTIPDKRNIRSADKKTD